MSVEQDIAQRIIDMLAAESDFDDIAAFFLGTPATIPAEFMPACEVVPLVSNRLDIRVGNTERREYLGQIRLYQSFQDLVSVTNRKAVVQSYVDIYTWTQAVRTLFQSNRTLQDLAGSGYSVIEIQIGAITTGIQAELERVETWENNGVIDFRVTVLERPV